VATDGANTCSVKDAVSVAELGTAPGGTSVAVKFSLPLALATQVVAKSPVGPTVV
jgi:hypothetical protein